MGSRAVAVLAKDPAAGQRRFGVTVGSVGVIYSRTGRPMFPELVAPLQQACGPLFAELDTDWLALDCELLPWSAKALGLIKEQYAAVGAAARTGLAAAEAVVEAAARRGLDVADLQSTVWRRRENADAFGSAYAHYCAPTDAPVTLAPFQILATHDEVPAHSRPHQWHLAVLGRLDHPLLTSTRHRVVDPASPTEVAAATQWWTDLTAAGGEGMVVKPDQPLPGVQPGLKVRGREYLRIIYGPDYTESLGVLRGRQPGKKRHLALREHGLGVDALTRFVGGEPLWRVHQLVFAVLALESEPVDPRL